MLLFEYRIRVLYVSLNLYWDIKENIKIRILFMFLRVLIIR